MTDVIKTFALLYRNDCLKNQRVMASLIATAQGSYILVKVVHLTLDSGHRDANCEYFFLH